MLQGFRDFILRGNVVDLAVGVVIGASFNAVVSGFTNAFVNPLIALLIGKPNFERVAFTLNGTTFPVGTFIGPVFAFLITAAVLYFLIVTPMNRIMNRFKNEEKPAEFEPSNQEKLLAEIRDALRDQNRQSGQR